MADGRGFCVHCGTGAKWPVAQRPLQCRLLCRARVSLITASIVLIVLLAETMRLYARLARSNAMLQREQNNKLMNIEAVVASIGHEIRQPLGAIELNSSSARMLLEEAAPRR